MTLFFALEQRNRVVDVVSTGGVSCVGHSEYTPVKQALFRKFLEMHVAITKGVIGRNNWAAPPYYYFDLNAGPGYLDGDPGSPVIFVETAGKVDLPFRAYFIEQDPVVASHLHAAVANIPNTTLCEGDHHDIFPDLFAIPKGQALGLIYSDPNGLAPFDLLALASEQKTFSRIDILIHFGATTIKRNRHYEETRLADQVDKIRKRHWLVREPEGQWQWSFLLGTNWADFPSWEKGGFHSTTSARGRDVLNQLNLTSKERKALEPTLF